MEDITARQESLSEEVRQASLAGIYPGFRVAGQALVQDVPHRDGQRGEDGTTRGSGPACESAAMLGFGPGVSGMSSNGFKPTIPVFNGKQEEYFSRWKQESVIYSRRYGFDAVFTRADECQDVNVGDPDCPMERLQDEFGADFVVSHLNAWQFLSSALKSLNNQDILFRAIYPGGALHSLVDTYSSKTQGSLLALLHKLDSVRIGTNDDPTLKLWEMEDIARSFCLSHCLQGQHLTDLYAIGKFVNTLPREYDIQKKMLEEREDGFCCKAIVSSVQKRFESSAYKQLRRSKSKSVEDQPFAVTGRGKNHPGRSGSRHDSGKSGGLQGGCGNGSSGRGGDGGSDGSVPRAGTSSGSSSTATAKLGGGGGGVLGMQERPALRP